MNGITEKIEKLLEERRLDLAEQNAASFCLYEKEIQFNKNKGSGFGNILIMAGGAGSGKGFVLDNFIAMKGKVLDVDEIKKMSLKAPSVLAQLKKVAPDADKDDFLRNPDNVSMLHNFVNNEKLFPDKLQANLFKSILLSHPDRRPNLIFDITLKDATKLINLLTDFKNMGYDPKKVHIVWVLNELSVALEQNKNRKRVVPEQILLATHQGAAFTMKSLINNFDGLIRSGVDGEVYIAFNKAGVDSVVHKTANTKEGKTGYVEWKSGYIRLKEVGKPLDVSKITDEVLAKIKSYVPEGIW